MLSHSTSSSSPAATALTGPDSRRFMTIEACADLCARLENLCGQLEERPIAIRAGIVSTWQNVIKWARNRVSILDDSQDNHLSVGGVWGEPECFLHAGVTFNQIDDASLLSAMRFSEEVKVGRLYDNMARDIVMSAKPPFTYPKTAIWSEPTYTQTADERVAIVRDLTDVAEQAGMLSAGDIRVEASGYAEYGTGRPLLYAPKTAAQCSITVRDPDGTGSGWAGRSSYDWNRFDARTLAATALDKCLRSRNPVAIEPGRYTTILEPQATFDFVIGILFDLYRMVQGLNSRYWESLGKDLPYFEPFEEVTVSRRPGARPVKAVHTKIGQQLVDERVTISYTPEDPDLGVLPWTPNSTEYEPVRAATFFERGVLKQLSYPSRHGRLGTNEGYAYRMSGGPTSVDEMIATTKRGLLVTRFSGLGVVDPPSLLYNGYTRDGLWLIENGKISHPVKNMRFTESPLFALNNLEQLGTPVGVFSPNFPAVVPPIKVRDFSFTALIDAV